MTVDTGVLHDCRDAWTETLISLAETDDRIVAVVNDSVGSSKLGAFQDRFPDRLVNVGIAEQDMVGVAAGLANGGRIPFVSGAGCFLTARAMEQIKVDLAYSRYNVKLIAQSPGVAYGELGATHHSIEDFAWMRTIPGMVVLSPADRVETSAAVRWAAEYDGPVYIRIPRMGIPDIHPADHRFALGKAQTLREGTDVTIVATGTTVSRALSAADLLAADGVAARVLAMPSIKPLDEEALIAAARDTGAIVTVEEALVTGLGGAVAETISETVPVPLRRVGMHDEFAPTGSVEWLFEHFGITPQHVRDVALELVRA